MIEGPAAGIVVAAGRSERMGTDKVFAPLAGRPLLAWTLRAFKNCEDIDRVVLVVARDAMDRAQAFVREWRFTNVAEIVVGGAERRDSVRAGLDVAEGAAIVAVHDGARPLVTPELISGCVALARESGAAICAVPSRDTVKQSRGDPPLVQSTLDRASAWLAQTPQCFERALLLRAHDATRGPATDDAALVEALGHDVRLYEGAYWNMKVTTPEDLTIAESLLRERLSRL
ncbi:MAG TPA: 2-C-methyl-D-erythritol 4-phosphate cytidylyltransferase [Vicinamibacterales bacterium]|jgi:2-C-methyl-D-erythritol 4-phosphate cytidylyltransferase